MKQKNTNAEFLVCYRYTGAILLQNLLTGKGTLSAGKETIRVGQQL